MDVKFLVVILALAGCSTTPAKSVHLPDGTQGYSIDCAWSGTWASCMNKAAKLCGRYTIVSQGGSSNGGMAVQAGAASISASSTVQEMIVRCDN